MHLEGNTSYDMVKHLLVDEMQDYTPIQYVVLSKWFSCKTILGDSNQSVNVYTSTSLHDIKSVFPHADTIELLKAIVPRWKLWDSRSEFIQAHHDSRGTAWRRAAGDPVS